MVDDSDYEYLSQFSWCAQQEHASFYAYRGLPWIKGKAQGMISMHRDIMKPGPNMVVDHMDFNGLNNCRPNLRVCTSEQNTRRQRPRNGGTSKYKGVSYNVECKHWRAQIGYLGRRLYLGSYASEQDAARAYDFASRKLHGEHVVLNAGYFNDLGE